MREITITQAEYTSLIEDSRIAISLLALIEDKAKKYSGISHNELEILCILYGVNTKENDNV